VAHRRPLRPARRPCAPQPWARRPVTLTPAATPTVGDRWAGRQGEHAPRERGGEGTQPLSFVLVWQRTAPSVVVDAEASNRCLARRGCGAPAPTPTPRRTCGGSCHGALGTVVRVGLGRPVELALQSADRAELLDTRGGNSHEGTHRPLLSRPHERSSGPSTGGLRRMTMARFSTSVPTRNGTSSRSCSRSRRWQRDCDQRDADAPHV